MYRDPDDCKCKKCPGNKKVNEMGDGCDDECPQDQISKGTNQNGELNCQKCPNGKKPNDDATQCVDDNSKCGPGEIKKGVGQDGKPNCEKCPTGKKPNADTTQCVDDDTNKCGPRRIKAGDKCTDCPPGLKANAAKTTCEEDKDRTTKKKGFFNKKLSTFKDDWNKRVKKTRMGECLPLTALMLPLDILPAADPFQWASEYFDEDFVGSDDMMQNWPDDVSYTREADIDFDKMQHAWMKQVNDIKEDEEWDQNHPSICGLIAGGKNKRCQGKKVRRDGPMGPSLPLPVPISNVRSMIPRAKHSKRQFQILGAILEACGIFLRAASGIIPDIVTSATRLASLVARGARQALSLARSGASKASRQEMKDATEKIVKDAEKKEIRKEWKNCLSGKGPDGKAP
ncbi:MAG: hypothetical protein Q9160_007123 [Pyrenula sp. 1 TL-2023]